MQLIQNNRWNVSNWSRAFEESARHAVLSQVSGNSDYTCPH